MPSWNALMMTRPNYEELVRFLIEPLLDEPNSLSIDSESSKGDQRVLIRLAFNEEDQGRVFGRGGRNIEAVRTVLETAAIAVGQSIRLEVFGAQHHHQGHSKPRGDKPKGDRRKPYKPLNHRSRPQKRGSGERPTFRNKRPE